MCPSSNPAKSAKPAASGSCPGKTRPLCGKCFGDMEVEAVWVTDEPVSGKAGDVPHQVVLAPAVRPLPWVALSLDLPDHLR